MSGSLALEGLRITSGDRVLVDGLSLTLRQGRVQALVGVSGSGKSLTTLALLGLLPAGVRQEAGRVLLNGGALDGPGIAAIRGGVVGLVQQSPRGCFNPVLTLAAHFREQGADRSRAAALLAEVGFDESGSVLRAYPFQLSGGMLQRAMIALALVKAPAFLIADEPTTDLDLLLQAQILDLLEGLRARRGLGILLVTHDLSVVARLADEVAVMEQGRIVERAAAVELFARPRSAAAWSLMATHLALYGEALE